LLLKNQKVKHPPPQMYIVYWLLRILVARKQWNRSSKQVPF